MWLIQNDTFLIGSLATGRKGPRSTDITGGEKENVNKNNNEGFLVLVSVEGSVGKIKRGSKRRDPLDLTFNNLLALLMRIKLDHPRTICSNNVWN